MNYHLTHRQNAAVGRGKPYEVRNSEHQLTHNCKHFSGAKVQTFSETTKKKRQKFLFLCANSCATLYICKCSGGRLQQVNSLFTFCPDGINNLFRRLKQLANWGVTTKKVLFVWFFNQFALPLQAISKVLVKGCSRVWAEMIPSNLIRIMPA